MKPIAIPRPTDPELRRQWDEAKRACEARPRGCLCQLEAGDSLCPVHPPDAAELAYAASIGAPYDIPPLPDPDCCVGDRSRCRCAPERGGWSDDDVEREKWAAVWDQPEDDR